MTARPVLGGGEFLVRTETDADHHGVRDVVARAFGQTDEAELVDALRADASWIPGLAVVAVTAGHVVGHALMTRLGVDGGPALALAPVAVAPEAQGVGVGSAMVRDLLRRATAAGERLVVVVGSPGYYGRFGFVAAANVGVEGFDAAGDAFQALPLGEPALAPRGRVHYPAPFGIPDS